ncbi:MAG: HisA/HisF-related TIM barrel protein, partial [Oscillospiraceae bacterium]
MKIYPAIDIINGQCVRLVQGDYSQKTTFSQEPLLVAKEWQDLGGEFLHIVDLDGAKNGDMPNFELISHIATSLNVPIEVGGGIRNMDCVDKYLNAGV